MPYKFLDVTATPSVRAAQAANGSRDMWEHFKGHRTFDRFTDNELTHVILAAVGVAAIDH